MHFGAYTIVDETKPTRVWKHCRSSVDSERADGVRHPCKKGQVDF